MHLAIVLVLQTDQLLVKDSPLDLMDVKRKEQGQLRSTKCFHLSFAERDIKNWATLPANTSPEMGRGC
jgi:hypothetical protein